MPHRGQNLAQERHPCQHVLPDGRMLLDDRELLRGQSARLGQDCVRHPNFAHVMQQPGQTHARNLGRGQAHCFRHRRRVRAHPLRVAARVRVLGIHSGREGLDRRHVGVL